MHTLNRVKQSVYTFLHKSELRYSRAGRDGQLMGEESAPAPTPTPGSLKLEF